MAVVTYKGRQDGSLKDKRCILRWIRKKFPFWAQKTEYDYLKDQCLRGGFDEYELPVFPQQKDHPPRRVWDVDSAAARDFLSRALELEPKEPYDFLQLPPEIRNSIYEMVLFYPRSGVSPTFNNTFAMVAKDISIPFSIDEWVVRQWPSYIEDDFNKQLPQERLFSWPADPDPYTQTALSKLAFLLANKQIFEEAMPIFYRLNTFVFTSAGHLESKLRSMPLLRRQHLRQIAFSYIPADVSIASSAFRYLETIPNLRKLHIDINEASWRRIQKLDDTPDAILKIQGLNALRKIRGVQEVVFSSRCPIIAAHLKAEMEGADTKKRKRADVPMTGRMVPARAAKSRKIGYA